MTFCTREAVMLSAFLETIGALGMLASIAAKIAAVRQMRKEGAASGKQSADA
jgi:hypothetical protein